MNCRFCKDELEYKLGVKKLIVNNKVVEIKNVPMYVCTNCGEEYFPGEVIKKLEGIKKMLSKKVKGKAVEIEYSQAG